MSLLRRDRIIRQPSREAIINIILISFCAFFVLYTFYINFNHPVFDSDVVNEIVYRRESFLQKSLYPEGYICGNESFASRPFFLYWIFYAITNNFMLSFNLENLCTLIILLILLYFYLRKLGVTKSYSLFGVCTFCITVSDPVKYVAFSPMNAYILFIFAVLVTLILRVNLKTFLFEAKDTIGKRRYVCSLIAILVLAAFVGYTTIKLVFALYLPLFFIDVLPIIWRFIHGRNIQKAQIKVCSISLVSLIINVITYILFLKAHGETITPINVSISGGNIWTNWEVLSAQALAVLQLFGDVTGGTLNSISGILSLLTVAYLTLGMVVLIWFIQVGRLQKKAYTDGFYYCFSATGLMFAYQVLTGCNISITRYYFPAGILIPILCIVSLYIWSRKHRLPYSLLPAASMGVGLVILFSLSVYSDYNIIHQQSETSLEKVANYIEEHNYSYVTASYWNAGIITGYTNGKVDAQHTKDMSTFSPYLWLTDKRGYSDPRYGVPNVLLITEDEEKEMDETLSLLLRYEGKKVADIDQYNLYEFNENPFVMIESTVGQYESDLPTQIGVSRKVTPKNGGFITDTGTMCENGFVISDGSAGFVMYGPYDQTYEGRYDIEVKFTILSFEEMKEGIADIAVDMQTICSANFSVDSQQIKFKDVMFVDGCTFEVRIMVPEGMIIQIESIQYTKTA